MPHIPDETSVNLLFKLLQSRGFTSISKEVFEEAIKGKSQVVTPDQVWLEAGDIPGTPPGGDTSIVDVHADVKMTADPTVGNNLVHLATATYENLATRIEDWIPETFGANYGVKLYGDDGAGAKGDRIYPLDPINWMFIYSHGILICESDPADAGHTLPLHIEGYSYVGDTGVPTVEVDKEFTYVQGVAAATWVVTHNLDKKVVPIVIDATNSVLHPLTITYDSDNQITLVFSSAVAGTLYLS